jgi:hypothetical protein
MQLPRAFLIRCVLTASALALLSIMFWLRPLCYLVLIRLFYPMPSCATAARPILSRSVPRVYSTRPSRLVPVFLEMLLHRGCPPTLSPSLPATWSSRRMGIYISSGITPDTNYDDSSSRRQTEMGRDGLLRCRSSERRRLCTSPVVHSPVTSPGWTD